MRKYHRAPDRQYRKVPPGVSSGQGSYADSRLPTAGSEFMCRIIRELSLKNMIGPVLCNDRRAGSARPAYRSVVVIHGKGTLLPRILSRHEDALRLVAEDVQRELGKLARS
jgi:hypothetical protein